MVFCNRKCLCFGAISLFFLGGCAPSRPGNFQNALVPAAPLQPELAVAIAPPPPPQNIYLASGTPRILHESPIQTPTPTQTDLLLARAQIRFDAGKRFFEAGNTLEARTEFDAAVDLLLKAGAANAASPSFRRRFDEMVDAIHRMDLAGLGSAIDEDALVVEKSPLEDILKLTFPVDPKLRTKVKDELAATSSQLPLSMNDSVIGFINYFSGRGHKTLVTGLQRAGRYRPMIERILAEEGVPPEIIHLAQAESGFLPRAMSRKSAGGMWQFLVWRGNEYGLKQTAYTDERFDPEKATRAAARHLRDLYHQFGDWYLAIAGYNCGPGNVERAVERTGYADFWELRSRRTLPLETTNYVPIILAMTIMTKNAKEYGLEDVVPDPPLQYETVKMEADTHLALIADLTDAPLTELQSLNPSLLKSLAPTGHSVRVPKDSATKLLTGLQAVPRELRATCRIHRASDGESLAGISRRYGAAASLVAKMNPVEADGPEEGDFVLIPIKPEVKTKARPTRKTVTRRRASSRTRRASR